MANFNFNKVIIGGRLTADPELKTTASGKSVTSITVAVNRRVSKDGEQVADFFNCTAWAGVADIICKHFHKSSNICIVGRLENRSWTATDGTKKYATDVIVDEVSFVDSKNENRAVTVPEYAAPQYTGETAPKFGATIYEEELPF